MPTSRRLRFFFWNDLHIRAPHLLTEHKTYPLANEKAAWAVECAAGEHGFEPPDFVVSGGDVIHGEIPDYGQDYAYYRALIEGPLPVPFLPCLGNHENRQGEGLPEQNRAYDEWVGAAWHNYLFRAAGLGFVVVDTSGAHREPDEVTARRNEFVERALRHFGDRPVIVMTHVPLVAMRELGPYRKSFGFSSWRVLDLRMLELIEEHAERVVAVLCGHIHLTGVRRQRGVWHIMPAGLGGYPADFASLDVYADRIEVTMHRPPDHLLDEGGNIHGARRHGIDYTDTDHPDHESYLWGNPDERRFTIPLAGAKRPTVAADEPLTVEKP